jgi:hypothetical protein
MEEKMEIKNYKNYGFNQNKTSITITYEEGFSVYDIETDKEVFYRGNPKIK